MLAQTISVSIVQLAEINVKVCRTGVWCNADGYAKCTGEQHPAENQL